MVSEADIAWATGVYEGEGCALAIKNKWGFVSPVMQISMTDRDVLLEVGRIFGGHVGELYDKSGVAKEHNRKPMADWRITSWLDFIRVADLMRPRLKSRRLLQLDKVLAHRPTHPHGTDWCSVVVPSAAGWHRHRKRGTPACENCKASDRWYQRVYRVYAKQPDHQKGLSYRRAGLGAIIDCQDGLDALAWKKYRVS